MPVRYAPDVIAHVRHRYENTADPISKIAADLGVSERVIHRMRDRGGWPRRSDGFARSLEDTLRAAQGLAVPRPEESGEGDETPTRDPPAASSRAPTSPPRERFTAAIERAQRLIEQELEAEEAVRAQLGRLPRTRREAARTARTLITLTQALQNLQRLRCGAGLDTGSNDDDDIPTDMDEFRRDLARRIDAFVASRIDARDADGDPAAAAVGEAR